MGIAFLMSSAAELAVIDFSGLAMFCGSLQTGQMQLLVFGRYSFLAPLYVSTVSCCCHPDVIFGIGELSYMRTDLVAPPLLVTPISYCPLSKKVAHSC